MSELTIFDTVSAGGKAKVAELLEPDAAAVNARDGEGATPRHRAALAGDREMALLLIDALKRPATKTAGVSPRLRKGAEIRS